MKRERLRDYIPSNHRKWLIAGEVRGSWKNSDCFLAYTHARVCAKGKKRKKLLDFWEYYSEERGQYFLFPKELRLPLLKCSGNLGCGGHSGNRLLCGEEHFVGNIVQTCPCMLIMKSRPTFNFIFVLKFSTQCKPWCLYPSGPPTSPAPDTSPAPGGHLSQANATVVIGAKRLWTNPEEMQFWREDYWRRFSVIS